MHFPFEIFHNAYCVMSSTFKATDVGREPETSTFKATAVAPKP